jgi:predicted ATP-dependent serine protease
MANKGEIIRDFLSKNNFTNCKSAWTTFSKKPLCKVSYARFSYIYKETFDQVATTNVNIVRQEMNDEQVKDEKIELTRLEDIHFPDSVLVPFTTETAIDTLATSDGGLLPATITMAPGESGVGKSTVLLKWMGDLKKVNKKLRLLFVSSEMNKIHLFKYSKRVKFEGVEILLLGDYENPMKALESVLYQGWDVVLIDSFQDTVDKICGSSYMKANKAESWLLNLLDKVRLSNNERKLYTAFICTQHMTKGAVYSGTTKVKHMTDAMIEFKYDDASETYVEYSKNRDGATKKRLYYRIGSEGVTYNSERFKRDEEVKQEVTKVKDMQLKKDAEWDQFFTKHEVKDNVNAN